MSSITHVQATQVPAYSGPHEIPGIRFRPVREALGVSSWGMNVLEIDAGCEGYPEHDHASDGHEEVYVVLAGSVTLRTPECEQLLATGDLVRVPGNVKRKLIGGETAATVLALGGTPGKAYAPSLGG